MPVSKIAKTFALLQIPTPDLNNTSTFGVYIVFSSVFGFALIGKFGDTTTFCSQTYTVFSFKIFLSFKISTSKPHSFPICIAKEFINILFMCWAITMIAPFSFTFFNNFFKCPGPPVDAPININFCATNSL